MTHPPRRLLACTDFSRGGDNAARRAARLAARLGAGVDLLHVLPPHPLGQAWQALQEAMGLDTEDVRRRAHARLDELGAELRAAYGPEVTGHMSQGRPVTEIPRQAQDLGADLIVLGAQGEHPLLDPFLGTTAQKVLRLAHSPVLLVKQAPSFAYDNLLVPTDFSAAAGRAARLALDWFPAARHHFLHAYELPYQRELFLGGVDEAAMDNYRRLVGDTARVQLSEWVDGLGLDAVRAGQRVRFGYAPVQIGAHAQELAIDLIVMGAQGMTTLEGTLLGSVSSHVSMEVPCDILLVRPE